MRKRYEEVDGDVASKEERRPRPFWYGALGMSCLSCSRTKCTTVHTNLTLSDTKSTTENLPCGREMRGGWGTVLIKTGHDDRDSASRPTITKIPVQCLQFQQHRPLRLAEISAAWQFRGPRRARPIIEGQRRSLRNNCRKTASEMDDVAARELITRRGRRVFASNAGILPYSSYVDSLAQASIGRGCENVYVNS
jgi:hypothetical protein